MSQSLAVKYRPKTIDEVVGQGLTKKILKQVIETRNLRNCYLFAGASGCGKTTCARAFANAINNNENQYIEIDAASNSGVDNVRAIMDSAKQRSLTSEYKIFIIDEAHALSNTAWQAFLKGIEETPAYTVFIFCTTEPNKIPQTILNRVQRFNIARLSSSEIKQRLEFICQQENFTNYSDACDFISKVCNGGMRDAITYLDQCTALSTNIDLEVLKAIVGGFNYEMFFKLTWALNTKDQAGMLKIIDDLYSSGQDMKAFVDAFLKFTLDVTKFILFNNISLTSIPEYLATSENPVIQYTVNIDNPLNRFNALSDTLLDIKQAIKYDTDAKSTVEVFLTKFLWS